MLFRFVRFRSVGSMRSKSAAVGYGFGTCGRGCWFSDPGASLDNVRGPTGFRLIEPEPREIDSGVWIWGIFVGRGGRTGLCSSGSWAYRVDACCRGSKVELTDRPRFRVGSGTESCSSLGIGRRSAGGVNGLAPPGTGFRLIFLAEELSSLEDR